MHELSIATAVVEQAEELARRHGGRSVRTVRLRVGEIAGVVPEALSFCFDVARSGTALSDAALVVDTVAARAHCAGCDADFAAGAPPYLWCPRCEKPAAELLSGRELEITGIELEEVGP